MESLSARERITLAVDTSRKLDALRLTKIARNAGARFVKFGLEFSSATSWQYCSELATKNDLNWIADAKLNDIPVTICNTIKNLTSLDHPPFAITMHTTAGKEAMRTAQDAAGEVKMLGVTVLSSINADEAVDLFGESIQEKVMKLARKVASVGVKGVVASPQEVGLIKSHPETQHLFAMIPGIRSTSVDAQDQSRVSTPAIAIRDGADLIVIGRQITQANDPMQAYEALVKEIEGAI